MSEIIQIRCQSCGSTIKSEHIHGSIVYCESCHSYKVLDKGSETLRPVFYKIYHHPASGKETNKQLYDFFEKIGDPTIFDRLEVELPIKRYYLPIREVLHNGVRKYVSLNEGESAFLETFIKDGCLDRSLVDRSINRREEVDLVTMDFKPVYLPKPEDETVFLPINVDMRKIDALYGVNQNEITIVKYLPIAILEKTNMGPVVFSGSTIFNKEEIQKIVNGTLETKKKWRINIKDVFSKVITSAIIIVILMAIYRALTSGEIFSAIGTAILWLFYGIYIAFFLGICLLGFIIITAPISLFITIVKDLGKSSENTSSNKPNTKKGKSLFNLA